MPQPQPVSSQQMRREAIASSLAEARRELERGEARRGTVEDLMRELSE